MIGTEIYLSLAEESEFEQSSWIAKNSQSVRGFQHAALSMGILIVC